MKAHIITIGDEILLGQTLNTNAAFIGGLLIENQVQLSRTSVVADDMDDILAEFAACLAKNDLLIVTGGLGPTHDDLTRAAVVAFFNTTLVKNEDVLHDITERFNRFNRPVTPANQDQAMVPACASIIRNKLGTAPGYWIEQGGKIFVAMPGVPYEMKEMMNNFVMPALQKRVQVTTFSARKTLLTTGIPESYLFERLGDIDALLAGGKLAFLPSQFGVKLRITAFGTDFGEAAGKVQEIEQRIRAIAGRYIYGNDDEELAEVVGRLLRERGLTISLAESCTGGNIANLLTNFDGSSKFFERGIVAYSNAAKVEILNVNEDTLMQYGAVSAQVAEQMAEGIKGISGTDIGLSVTGILGPAGGTAEKPVGTVYIGYADNNTSFARHFRFGDDRRMNKDRITQAALDLVRKQLLGISVEA